MSNELLNSILGKIFSLFKSKYIYCFVVFIALLTLMVSAVQGNPPTKIFLNLFVVSFVSIIIMLIVYVVISTIIEPIVSGAESAGASASETDFLDSGSDYDEDIITSDYAAQEGDSDNSSETSGDEKSSVVDLLDASDELPGSSTTIPAASAPMSVDNSESLPGDSGSATSPQAQDSGSSGGGFVDFDDFDGGSSKPSAPPPPAQDTGSAGGGFVDFEDFGGGGGSSSASSAPPTPPPPADSGGGGFIDFDDFGGGDSGKPSSSPPAQSSNGGGSDVDFFDFDAGGGGSSTPSVAPAPASSSANGGFEDFDNGGLPSSNAKSSKEVDNSSKVMYDDHDTSIDDTGSIDSIIFGGGEQPSKTSDDALDVENLVAESRSSKSGGKSSGKVTSFENFAQFGDPALAAQAIRTTLRQDKSEGNS